MLNIPANQRNVEHFYILLYIYIYVLCFSGLHFFDNAVVMIWLGLGMKPLG